MGALNGFKTLRSFFSGLGMGCAALAVGFAVAGAPLISAPPAQAATAKEAQKSSTKQNVSSKKRSETATKKLAKKSRKKANKTAAILAPSPDRYAVLLMNADTGAVLYQENADAVRHPASLTKMMTLYLTFEALKSGKLKLDQELPVSYFAASQPQTHIGLTPGDSISVRDAIKALVVRSANDVAVVLAEALGGNHTRFAQLMTAKSRQLGMKRSVFMNASGLPDPGQITTARDMAALGMALKKNFPQYYNYFNTREFTYGGRTYTTHNRVLNRLPGADGIKTGYIGMSGFNLVTSAKRNGEWLVGVVMGGTSASMRDSQMVSMMEQGFTVLAEAKKHPGETQLATIKTPPAAETPANTTETALLDTPEETSEGDTGDQEIAAASPAPSAAAASLSPAANGTPAATALPTPTMARSSLPSANASIGAEMWGVQVGAFSRPEQAEAAARKAKQLVGPALSNAQITVTGAGASATKSTAAPNLDGVHRARLSAITKPQAETACRKLAAVEKACFVFQQSAANGRL